MVKAAPPNTSAHFDTTTMVYIFTNATGSKIFNFNKFRNTLDVQGFLDDNSTLPWECTGSPFVDKNHMNNKWRKFFWKGSKYRENRIADYDKTLISSIDGKISHLSTKGSLTYRIFP